MLNVTQRQPQALAKAAQNQVTFRETPETSDGQATPEKIGYTVPVATAAVLGSTAGVLHPFGTAGKAAKAAEVSRFSLAAEKIGEKIATAKTTVLEKLVGDSVRQMLQKSGKNADAVESLITNILKSPADIKSILTDGGINESHITKFEKYHGELNALLDKPSADIGKAVRNPKLLLAAGTAVVAAGLAALFVNSANKAKENAEI